MDNYTENPYRLKFLDYSVASEILSKVAYTISVRG